MSANVFLALNALGEAATPREQRLASQQVEKILREDPERVEKIVRGELLPVVRGFLQAAQHEDNQITWEMDTFRYVEDDGHHHVAVYVAVAQGYKHPRGELDEELLQRLSRQVQDAHWEDVVSDISVNALQWRSAARK